MDLHQHKKDNDPSRVKILNSRESCKNLPYDFFFISHEIL